VRVDRSAPLTTMLLWLGVLGGPAAWALQLLIGWTAEEADCSLGTARAFDATHGVNVWVSVGAGATALAALAAAALVWVGTRRGAADPRGRVQFMALSGLLASSLFLALIIVTAVGTTHFQPCVSG
jgi:hypothetical protein